MDIQTVAGIILGIMIALPVLLIVHMAVDYGRRHGIVHKADDADEANDNGEH